MLDFFTKIDDFVWGPPLLVLLVGTGIYLTIRLGLLQVLRLPKAFKLIFAEDKGEGDISSFAALATALAATVGTGNIVGVATAIGTGGPGALFWMWMAAKTHEPVEQGLISMTGTFIDTIIICTLTGLSILITGQWSVKGLEGAAVTQSAFSSVFGNIGSLVLTLSLALFAFTTILGWSYYGERCVEFVFGTKGITIYRCIFVFMVALGGYLQLQVIWKIADIVNGLMALPNLIALLVLSPIIIKETKSYFKRMAGVKNHVDASK